MIWEASSIDTYCRIASQEEGHDVCFAHALEHSILLIKLTVSCHFLYQGRGHTCTQTFQTLHLSFVSGELEDGLVLRHVPDLIDGVNLSWL